MLYGKCFLLSLSLLRKISNQIGRASRAQCFHDLFDKIQLSDLTKKLNIYVEILKKPIKKDDGLVD